MGDGGALERPPESPTAARGHHALLIVGPPVSTRAAARRVAAERLCRSPVGLQACDACDDCARVRRGTHPDVYWIGADGPLGVPEARALSRAAGLAPDGRASVFVVEACERLTGFAAAALLKTLEEPPGLAVFMLLADQPDRIEPTLRSRCELVRLPPIADPAEEPPPAAQVAVVAARPERRRPAGRARAASAASAEPLEGAALSGALLAALSSLEVAGAMSAAARLADASVPVSAMTAAVRDLWLHKLRLIEAAGGPRSSLGMEHLEDLAHVIQPAALPAAVEACAAAEAAEASRVNALTNWEFLLIQLRRLHNAC